MSSNMDMSYLKQALHETREDIIKLRRDIRISNLLSMVELGIISKEDFKNNEDFKEYTKSLNLNNSQKKSFR